MQGLTSGPLPLASAVPEPYTARPSWVAADVPDELLDFRNFLCLVWEFLGLPSPTPLQYDIATWIQHGPRRKVVCAFRGVGKSWITSAYVCWRLYLDPSINVLVVSASRDRADQFSAFTLRLLNEMPLLQHLAPQPHQRSSMIAFDVAAAPPAHAPSVKSVGIFGQLAGSRADLIVADDVEVPNNSYSELMRERLSEAVREFDAILKPQQTGRPRPEVVYLGTPQTEDSLYNKLIHRNYVKRIWPSRFPATEKKLADVAHELAPYIAKMREDMEKPWWQPTDTRFQEEELQEREASYGRSGYALQFQLDTSLSDAERYPLKLSDLIVTDLNTEYAHERYIWARDPDREWKDLPNVGLTGDRFYRPMAVNGKLTKYQGAVLAIDPSGRGKDETSYAVVKMLHGMLFLIDAGGLKGDGYDDKVLNRLARLAKQHSVNEVLIESNFGDGMFLQLFQPVLRKVHPVHCEEIRHTLQKERRIIDSLEPVMNQHRLIVNASIVENDRAAVDGLGTEESVAYQLFHQMTRITTERNCLRHDDRIDVVAMGVRYWTDQMGQGVDDAVEQAREEALDAELASFADAYYRSSPTALTQQGQKRPDAGYNWLGKGGRPGQASPGGVPEYSAPITMPKLPKWANLPG